MSDNLVFCAGFDPCTESFKGLADLIEKENGMQQQQQQQYLHLRTQQQLNRLGSPPQTNFYPHTMTHTPLQNSSQLVRSLPPGFSITQIQLQQQQLQQQQQQHFYRPGESVF